MDDMAERRAAWRAKILTNIERHGHHVTVVLGHAAPRFAYTIGVSARRGVELILAGGHAFETGDVGAILNRLAADPDALDDGVSRSVGPAGDFRLRRVDPTWAARLTLGIPDVLGREVPVLQVVPVGPFATVDVPDLSAPGEPVGAWRWLDRPWPFSVPEDAYATTDLSALQGRPVTEAIRWEEGRFQLFSGDTDAVPEEALRNVPLGVLLGIDPTLEPVVGLEPGQGLLREPGGPWSPWT